MDKDQQFEKYQWIDVEVTRPRQDARPESFTPNLDSISIVEPVIPPTNHWAARKEFIIPMIGPSMCELQRLGSKPSGPSLGLIKPKKIRGLSITNEESTDWTEEEFSKLRQFSLFDNAPRRELEKIPFRFTYHYECEDSGCRGHKMKCTDWEMAALYRRLRFDYGEKWQDPFLDMYQTRMINDFDTHFYVGTVSGPWDTWIIIGVWRAPKTDQMLMF